MKNIPGQGTKGMFFSQSGFKRRTGGKREEPAAAYGELCQATSGFQHLREDRNLHSLGACLEERQLMRMSMGGCAAAHLLLPATFSLWRLGLTKSTLWGRITHLQPRIGTDSQRAVCSAGRLEEAERHSRGQERAADWALRPWRARTNGNTTRLGEGVESGRFTAVHTGQGIRKRRELPWLKGKARFQLLVPNTRCSCCMTDHIVIHEVRYALLKNHHLKSVA